MRAWSLGVAVLAVLAGFSSGCGGTSAGDTPHGTGGASATAGTSGTDGGTAASHGGLGGTATNAGTGGASGMGGGPTLPPDGPIAAAVPLHKLDVLLMVDNSRNMLEKQRLLTDALTWLLGTNGPKLSADDIHIGVVTSSLGAHGATGTKDVCVQAEADDHAHLLGQARPNLTTFQNSGFLAWGPSGDPDKNAVITALAPMIQSAGEHGCGYEASLEAWFRFLIDPEPPVSVVLQNQVNGVLQGVDATILAQRAAFLRPDSVLAIVMLSDENDCSIQDEGYGWLISRAAPMFRSTSACQANPNDKCCQSCTEFAANPGCPALASDSECAKGSSLTAGTDDLNLRCWEQKRRFGFSLLQPLSRYRDGLTRQTVFNRARAPVANPLFSGPAPHRHPSQVILTGIVGVPWQDLADQTSLTGPGLTYLTAAQLTAQGRWPMMVGDPEASPPTLPSDPFMIETPLDRSQSVSVKKHPLVDATLVASTSTDPQANVINGHEAVNVANSELQAACTLRLQHPTLCDQAANDAGLGCRCFQAAAAFNYADCQPPTGGAPGTLQYYEHAYPGTRELELLQMLGDNAVAASICPKVVTDADADYGYRPAMKALAARLETAFKP